MARSLHTKALFAERSRTVPYENVGKCTFRKKRLNDSFTEQGIRIFEFPNSLYLFGDPIENRKGCPSRFFCFYIFVINEILFLYEENYIIVFAVFINLPH